MNEKRKLHKQQQKGSHRGTDGVDADSSPRGLLGPAVTSLAPAGRATQEKRELGERRRYSTSKFNFCHADRANRKPRNVFLLVILFVFCLGAARGCGGRTPENTWLAVASLLPYDEPRRIWLTGRWMSLTMKPMPPRMSRPTPVAVAMRMNSASRMVSSHGTRKQAAEKFVETCKMGIGTR